MLISGKALPKTPPGKVGFVIMRAHGRYGYYNGSHLPIPHSPWLPAHLFSACLYWRYRKVPPNLNTDEGETEDEGNAAELEHRRPRSVLDAHVFVFAQKGFLPFVRFAFRFVNGRRDELVDLIWRRVRFRARLRGF